MILLFGPFGAGGSSIIITSPTSGYLSNSKQVTINGNSSGTQFTWTQTSSGDFNMGSRDNVTVLNGTVTLKSNVYDDFNDNSFDVSRWSRTTSGGMSVTEAGGTLMTNATSTAIAAWGCNGTVLSTAYVSNAICAELRSFSGCGTGYMTAISLYSNASNNMTLGQCYDPAKFGPGAVIRLDYSEAGVNHTLSLGSVAAGPHNYSIVLDAGKADLYQDSLFLATVDFNITAPKFGILSACRSLGDSLNASWDTVRENLTVRFRGVGNFTSSLADTGCTSPPILVNVGWGSVIPAETCLTVEVRGGDDPLMTGATPWTEVMQNQSAALPAVKRYLQYRALFSTSNLSATPVLLDMNITYCRPVLKVEVSTDSRYSWQLAQGTDHWSCTVTLPENNTIVWARVTDILGTTSSKSISVNVDTTPPKGALQINAGANFTSSNIVLLTFTAVERYGIASMMIGEDPGFSGMSWANYTSSRNYALSPGDGLKTIFAKLRDVAGWESEPFSDSVTLDTLPPKGSVVIENGADVTKKTTVRLTLNATDTSGLKEMMLSNHDTFDYVVWIPYESTYNWSILTGSGPRTVFAKFRDRAGQVSGVVTDSITLDNTPPSFRLIVNGGAAFTNSNTVSVEFNVTEDHRVSFMQVDEKSVSTETQWVPYQQNFCFTFSPGDGNRAIYARLRDAAGNDGPTSFGGISVDTKCPVSSLSSLPNIIKFENFTVTWSSGDATSGVLWHDVQVKDGGGDWTDWILHGTNTSSLFIGQDGHTYSFRVRAQDLSGNLEPFSDLPGAVVLVRVPVHFPPLVSSFIPAANTTVKGVVTISGTCTHPEPGKQVLLVSVQIDDGPWQNFSGADNWSLKWDTTKVDNGRHVLRARAFDGERYSTVAESPVTVSNQAAAKGIDPIYPVGIGVVVMAAAAGGALVLVRRRRDRGGRHPQAGQETPTTAAFAPEAPIQSTPQPGSPPHLDLRAEPGYRQQSPLQGDMFVPSPIQQQSSESSTDFQNPYHELYQDITKQTIAPDESAPHFQAPTSQQAPLPEEGKEQLPSANIPKCAGCGNPMEDGWRVCPVCDRWVKPPN